MAAAGILFTLWMATVFPTGLGCPALCSCTDKYGRHFAECSYKDLAEVPDGLPANVTTVSLSANKISVIPLGSFDNVTRVTSLWMAHNEIVTIEEGTLTPLVHLRNFDIGHNRIVDFPWEDLQNLTGLQLLKMNHNEMVHLPRDAFYNLKDLRSLRLNNNNFITIIDGTFDGLVSLSHLQVYKNPFACTCSLDWLRDWISKTMITVPEQNLITCATPPKLRGEVIGKLPESKCTSPNVTIQIKPNVHNKTFHEGGVLVLTCEFVGNPKPLVMWNIQSKSQRQELVLSFTEDDSAESKEDSMLSYNPFKVFNNGTLIISHIRKEDGGNYSCSATNEFGRSEVSVSVDVVALPKPTPRKPISTTPVFTKTHPSIRQTTGKPLFLDSVHHFDIKRKDFIKVVPTFPPTVEIKSSEESTTSPSHASKCGLTANTRYISSHVFNESVEDIKQYTFDFGVIALGVSETEATVRLNPLLIPRDSGINQAPKTAAKSNESFHNDSEKHHGLSAVGKNSNGLYLCVAADLRHSAVQWSRIKDGVNTYMFSGLRPDTNYSLCLTYRGEDCEVQVLFSTRRRVPNLLIIISVSICLLTVSTVPLLGATCFHLVYKYRSKTYKLILKAKDQYHMERNLAPNFRAPHTESRRKINGSQLDEEEGETESGDGDKEADTEESVMTESFSLSQCRGNLDNCEVGSEFSDRLPLGAEAVNITSNYTYPNQ
ncbi:hypothetical protein OYC64_015922 [Pagothenia borchgrevinki]|uniref:Ig-like domain-containing protein n=1 Tax=Pagothenia borchgrevinki TaxID=8213 RepID=A0ABD2HJ85_PAGBO